MHEMIQYGIYLAGLLLGFGLLLAGVRHYRAGVATVGLAVFFSSIATQRALGESFHQTWLDAMQDKRAELYLAASCILFLIVASNTRYVRMSRISVVAMVMLLINVFAGVLDTRTGPADGAMRIGLAIISLGSMMMYVSGLVRSWDDLLPLMRALGVAGVVWIGGSFVQVVLDKTQVLMNYNTRFVGLLGNPQGTALYLAPQATILLWLMLNDTKRLARYLWAAAYAAALTFVVWTGSRTGMLMAIIGATALLQSRFKRAIILLPALAISLVGVAYIVDSMGIELPFKRLVSGGDTRTEAWMGLLNDALRAGLFGEGITGARFVENSYLFAWVVYGPIMLAILIFQLLVMGVNGLKVWRVRNEVPIHVKAIIELIIAYYAMFFVGAQFEWFILSRVDANLSYIVIFSCVSTSIVAMVNEQRSGFTQDAMYDPDIALEYGEGLPREA